MQRITIVSLASSPALPVSKASWGRHCAVGGIPCFSLLPKPLTPTTPSWLLPAVGGQGLEAFARLASEAVGPPGSRARPCLPRACHECVLLLHRCGSLTLRGRARAHGGTGHSRAAPAWSQATSTEPCAAPPAVMPNLSGTHSSPL